MAMIIPMAAEALATPKRIGVAAMLAGSVIVGGMHELNTGDSNTVRPGTSILQEVKLVPGTYCDAEATGLVQNIGAVMHKHKGPSFLPDWYNESVVMNTQVTGKLCVDMSAIRKATYNQSTKKFELDLVSDPDPAKSDFSLTVYPTDPFNTSYVQSSNILAAAANDLAGRVKAVAQIFGNSNLKLPTDNVLSELIAIDTIQAPASFGQQCGTIIINHLQGVATTSTVANHPITAANDAHAYKPADNAPATLSGDIAEMLAQEANSLAAGNPKENGIKYNWSNFDVKIAVHDGGLPDQWTSLRKAMSDADGKNDLKLNFPSAQTLADNAKNCTDATAPSGNTGQATTTPSTGAPR